MSLLKYRYSITVLMENYAAVTNYMFEHGIEWNERYDDGYINFVFKSTPEHAGKLNSWYGLG